MKLLVVVVCFLLIGTCTNGEDLYSEFTKYIKKYNKRYSVEEIPLRFANYQLSRERIFQNNMYSDGVIYGINKFSDMTPSEFQTKILMKNPIVPPNANEVRNPNQVVPKKEVHLPTQFDWRELGAVTAVKDQEQCGSCWAFSVVENIESQWILGKKATNTTIALAPQQLVDCNWDDLGCNGGIPILGYDYVISVGGLDSEMDYPYTAESGTCEFSAQYIAAKISSWKYANQNWLDESEIQQTLVSQGPLSICVDASLWQDYESGVFTADDCADVNLLDHAVALVGYNTQNSSAPYWVVRNSWGEDWGINGYIYLEMWQDTCGLADLATTSLL